MPTLDTTGKAALASAGFAVAWFIFLDVSGDPVRITTHGQNITFSSTGDTDLDGNTFNAFDGRAISVSGVNNSDSGSATLNVVLSGIVSIDTTLLNEIGNTSLWQGRTIRIWFQLYDPTGVTSQGAVVPHYTGYMTAVDINDSPETQTITLSCENYLVAMAQPSNRSYLNQKDYDSADNSAAATIAAANGARHVGGNGGAGIVTRGAGGSGNGSRGHVNFA